MGSIRLEATGSRRRPADESGRVRGKLRPRNACQIVPNMEILLQPPLAGEMPSSCMSTGRHAQDTGRVLCRQGRPSESLTDRMFSFTPQALRMAAAQRLNA